MYLWLGLKAFVGISPRSKIKMWPSNGSPRGLNHPRDCLHYLVRNYAPNDWCLHILEINELSYEINNMIYNNLTYTSAKYRFWVMTYTLVEIYRLIYLLWDNEQILIFCNCIDDQVSNFLKVLCILGAM